MLRAEPRARLAVAANFVEVFLAKQGHQGPVGVNYLEKIQMATPAAVYGAMLAGVDYVLVGAGIPSEIPHLLDELADQRKWCQSVRTVAFTPLVAIIARHAVGDR